MNVPTATATATVPAPRRRFWRRGPWELAATLVIAAGVLMLLQPFWLVLYTYSFATTLAGIVLFMAASKFPD
jgi:hypothetical protein